jgi:Protein of unknown function (DUF1574)
MSYHRRRNTKARLALFWAVLGFFGVQVALDVGVVARHPELDDPEFGRRLTMLRERMAEAPGRPLMLLLGSSRTEMNFQPELLPPLRTTSGEQPLVFNFSHLGAGPGMNLLELRRLLRNGIRPEWLVIEVMPSQLGDRSQSILVALAGARDLSMTRRYRNPWQVYGYFLRNQLVPCYKHRMFLAHQTLPGWVAPADWEKEQIHLGELGGDYSWQAEIDPTPDRVRERTESARIGYSPTLQDLHLVDLSDRAMHEMLDLCRQTGIRVALLLSPEGRAFQSWYSPEARQMVDRYCGDLSRDYGLPLIDARNWLDDSAFLDSHHVTVRGAEAFTRRLGPEALQPFVEGKLTAAEADGKNFDGQATFMSSPQNP